MTARQCFTAKMRAGRVAARAGDALLRMIDAFETEHGVTGNTDPIAMRRAAADAAQQMTADAARRADLTHGAIVAQSNVLARVAAYDQAVTALRETKGDFGFGNKAPPTLGKATQTPLGFAMRSILARDPWEIADWQNVHYLARSIRADIQTGFAQAIEYLRPKNLGVTAEHTRELDVLRALYGRADVPAEAGAAARAFSEGAEKLRQQFVEAGGALPERRTWRLPNPDLDPAKVRAMGRDGFKAFARDRVDRGDMLDFNTGQPLGDVRFEQLLDRAFDTVSTDGHLGLPTGGTMGGRMLANSRDFGRFFAWKDAESWLQIADAFGTHQSPYHTMLSHIGGMADDIAAMRILGPNPEATRRFMGALFDRETNRLQVEAGDAANPAELAAATRTNRRIEARVRTEKKLTDDLYAEVTGANRIPVNTTLATGLADVRHVLSAAQLGQALISSFSDLGTMAMTARMSALPVTKVLGRAIEMASQKGSEIFAAQMGLVADTLAHHAGQMDRLMGETIRMGVAAKLSSAVIRASGLRRWTALLRASFGLEMMAKLARDQGLEHGALDPQFRASLARYGIGEAEWRVIQQAQAHEPRPGAPLLRPADIADRAVSEKVARLVNTEMDYAVIEGDPVTRAMLIGDTRPGTVSGEIRRSISQYRQFPASFMMYHLARGASRGWDGSRLGHLGLTFIAASLFGALSMQIKEMNAGRDPLSLDPRTGPGLQAWGKAILQGGGFGVFGDVFFADKTRMDNSWAATLAGPVASGVEDVLGKFLIRNVELAAKGKPTHFAGDALYTVARYTPGSSLWYAKLAFQRAVLDQAAQMIDERARERFSRMESTARKDFGQSYWWHPGQAQPERAPAFGGSMVAR